MRLNSISTVNKQDKAVELTPKVFMYKLKGSAPLVHKSKSFVATNLNLEKGKSELVEEGSSESIEKESGGKYLGIETIRKMLKKLLLEKKIERKDLAKSLGIQLARLDQILFSKPTEALIKKVNLPLVKLYCETKFNNQKEEKSDAIK